MVSVYCRQGQSQYQIIIIKFMMSQKLKQNNYKLQIILKDEEGHFYNIANKDKSLSHTKNLSNTRHQESSILAVAEQCLRLLDHKQLMYKDNRGFVSMMESLVADFKAEKSKERSIKKAKSSKKSKQKSCYSSKGQTVFETNFQNSSKMQMVKKIKLMAPTFFLNGQKSEQFEPIKKAQSTYDLKLRLKVREKVSTARSPQNQQSRQLSINSKSSLSRRSKLSSFNFKDYEEEYTKKLKCFLDFLYKINFSNKIYIQLQLKSVEQKILKYRVFVGRGNNDQLVKELLRRRFWYQITANKEQCHFYWTQFSLPDQHSQQKSSKNTKKFNQNEQKASVNHISQSLPNRSLKFKVEVKKEASQLNNKFLKREDSSVVQNLIAKEGYFAFNVPFKFITVTNHIPGTGCITSKKNLVQNIKKYYQDILQETPFTIIPQSFHIMNLDSTQMRFFLHYASIEPKKLWIIKPSENSCNCQGIEILPANQISKRLKQKWEDQNQTRSFVVQKYLQNPLLYNNRKFDIRHYMLLTCMNGLIKAYWFRQGYIRTSSEIYQLVTKINSRNPQAKKFKNQFAQQQSTWLKNRAIHFTNDAVQEQSKDYEKYEAGNKLSYNVLQKYFDYSLAEYPFFGRIVPKMKQIAKKVLQSVRGKIDPERRTCNFQLLALDYILDEDFNVWLLGIHKNPNYSNSSPVLDRVIPSLLQQTIRFCVDPLLPPQNHFPANERHFLQSHSMAGLKFELFYQQ